MGKRLHISYKDYLNSINEEVLNEKVFDINDDVDFLIKESGIEKFYNEIKEGKLLISMK